MKVIFDECTASEMKRVQSISEIYKIEVRGRLDPSWSDWFGGMQIESGGDPAEPVTILTGEIVDQPVLRGMLKKLGDLNLTVLSVTRVDPGREKQE